jgi:hypothetical protein
VVWCVFAGEEFFHGWNKVIGHGAANAAVGEFHHIVFGAGFIAAAFEDISVNTKIAKLIDDQRNAPATCVLQQVPNECGFSSTKEARHNSRRNFLSHFIFQSFFAALGRDYEQCTYNLYDMCGDGCRATGDRACCGIG